MTWESIHRFFLLTRLYLNIIEQKFSSYYCILIIIPNNEHDIINEKWVGQFFFQIKVLNT